MRIATWVAAAAVLLAGAPVALAHEGSPNFLSEVNRVSPDGIAVDVLNRDDRLLLRNESGQTVVILGYSREPHARVDADGTVYVNTDSRAYYINQERDGNVEAPDRADSDGQPRWEEVSKTGRFDSEVPLEVDGRPGAIAGSLFWTPVPDSDAPLAAIFAFAALVIVLCIAVVIRRRRRAPATEAW